MNGERPRERVPVVTMVVVSLQKNITHITYALSLESDPQVIGNIIRNPVVRLDYRCVFPYVRKVSLPFHIIPYST